MSWKTVRLGDVCEVLDKLRKPITKKDRVKGKFPYYGATGIVDHISEYIFDDKLVLIGEDGAKWESGEKTAFIADGKYWVNNHAHVIRPKTDLIIHEWIVYYFFITDLNPWISGLTVPKLNQGNLISIPIPLPPLEEQKRIVAKLDAVFEEIDKAIEIETKQLDNYDALQALILYSVYASLDENLIQLGDVCKFVRGPFGGSLKKEIFKESGFAVYEQQHAINNHSSKFRYFIDGDKFDEMERFQVLSNDILMSCSGTIGKTTIVPNNAPKGIINQALLKITPSKKINSEFLQSYMQSSLFKKQLMQDVSGSAIQNVASVKILKTIKIPFIPLSDQINIVRILNDQKILFEENKKKNQKKLEELHQLRSSILTKELKS